MGKKTARDPSGQASNRSRTTRRLDARLESARRKVLTLFRAVPRTRRLETPIVNAQKVVYDYDLNPAQLEDLNAATRAIVNEELLETQGEIMPPTWWYQPEVELPTRQGTLEEIVQFNQLIAGAVASGITFRGMVPQRVAPELILTSRPYLDNLRNVYVKNFSQIKSLSSQTSSQVIQRMNSGISAGLTPTRIAADITERFDVSKSNAKRIAETEVNRAYNDAKMNAVDMAAEQSGARAGVIHISALTATTRPDHAARHGNAYTTADQRAWWDSGSNRINCKCTTRSALIDDQGNVIEKEAQEKTRREGKEFFAKAA